MFSLILPTYKEAQNIPVLLPKLEAVLSGIPYEIIIVDDDSPDKTWQVAQELTKEKDHIHVMRRIGRRGLSSAVIEGFLASKGDVLAVMDADGQHDLTLLPKLYEATQAGADMAIGSRYIEGGGVGNWDERRQAMSRLGTQIAIKLCKVQVKDPMSGFFAITRETFEKALPDLNPKGFKILLDLLVHVPKSTKVTEVPFTFGLRLHGESKLSGKVQLEFLEYIYDVTVGKYIPLTFVKYCIVGTLGIGVNLGAYLLFSYLLSEGGTTNIAGFRIAVIAAIEVAIIFNFLLNNVWTFSNARLRGGQMIFGFLKYNFACFFGALANYAVSSYLYSMGWAELLSVVIGSFTGIIWNYTMSRIFAWKGA